MSGETRYTWAELRAAVRAFAKGLHAAGVRRGDKVAILMGNRHEWIVADLAICLLGGTMVSLNTWVTGRELRYMLDHSDATLLITVPRFLKTDYLALLKEIGPLAETLPKLRRVVVAGGDPGPHAAWEEILAGGAGVPEEAIEAAQRAIDPADVAYILYTSGSTSTPKGVQLQHYALIENMWHIGERMRVTHEDRLWLAVSLFWGLGCENALFNLYTHGGCIVLQEHFDAGEALALIEAERCTVFYGTPNMAQAMAEHPDAARRDLSSLRTGGTVGTPEQIMRVVDLGAREICNIYGLTETYGNCCVTDAAEPLEVRLRTVGKPLPGVTLRILDPETGAPLGPGEAGEIRVKGYVTVGYYKDEDKNREAFDADGFFVTGDLGVLDADGHLSFRGRIKEMIKTGGINVAPVEVEEILMAHPSVHLAFAVGLPDPVRDEIVGAVIVPPPGVGPDLAAIEAHCREALAAYKRPRRYAVVREAELPLTVTGKVQKNRLHELFAQAGADGAGAEGRDGAG